jgi:hypothetical protein
LKDHYKNLKPETLGQIPNFKRLILVQLVAVEGIFAVKCLATVSMFWIISRNASSKLRYFSIQYPVNQNFHVQVI